MHPYVASLKTLFEQNADPTLAGPMKKYMRDQFEYLGIKSPQVKTLFRQTIQENGLPGTEELDKVIRELAYRHLCVPFSLLVLASIELQVGIFRSFFPDC